VSSFFLRRNEAGVREGVILLLLVVVILGLGGFVGLWLTGEVLGALGRI